MRADVTVITPTIPGREQLLAEAIASVFAQTIEPEAHLISAQSRTERHPGPLHIAKQRNRLLPAVNTTWIASVDDDDLWMPDHLEKLMAHTDRADVVYSWDAEGRTPRLGITRWPDRRLISQLESGNVIPSNALIRARLLEVLGGWSEAWRGGEWQDGGRYNSNAQFEDWDLWLRAARRGARFVCVRDVTWHYRTGDWPRTLTHLGAA